MSPVGALSHCLSTSSASSGAATAQAVHSRPCAGCSLNWLSRTKTFGPQTLCGSDALVHHPARHSLCLRQFNQHRLRPQASNNSGGGNSRSPLHIDTPELLVGDCVALLCFALYKQIAAIVLSPSFPGWLAPLSFSPLRFAEFANFAAMLLASWVVAAALTGGYSCSSALSSTPAALRATCRAWLVSMPLAAAQLVLVTAAESQALVGAEGWGEVLPLAASGPGEPLGTAAALLGVMSMWRAFYVVYIYSWSQGDFAVEARRLQEALAVVAGLAAVAGVMLQLLQLAAAGEDGSLQAQLGLLADSLWGG